jgi:hypothetical protein
MNKSLYILQGQHGEIFYLGNDESECHGQIDLKNGTEFELYQFQKSGFQKTYDHLSLSVTIWVNNETKRGFRQLGIGKEVLLNGPVFKGLVKFLNED